MGDQVTARKPNFHERSRRIETRVKPSFGEALPRLRHEAGGRPRDATRDALGGLCSAHAALPRPTKTPHVGRALDKRSLLLRTDQPRETKPTVSLSEKYAPPSWRGVFDSGGHTPQNTSPLQCHSRSSSTVRMLPRVRTTAGRAAKASSSTSIPKPGSVGNSMYPSSGSR